MNAPERKINKAIMSKIPTFINFLGGFLTHKLQYLK